MSSSEQAPEPTMDEILASIRKIISDDEPEEAAKTEETARPDVAASGLGARQQGAASADLVDALDREQEPAEASDEILDLTEVVVRQVSVEVERADLPPGPPQGDALRDALKDSGEMATPDISEAAQGPATARNISDLLAEAGTKDTPADGPATTDASMEVPGDDSSGSPFGRSDERIAPAGDTAMPGRDFSAMTEPVSDAFGGASDEPVEPPPPIELPDVPLADAAADEEATEMMADVVAAETEKNKFEDASMDFGAPRSEELTPKMPDLPPEFPATEPESASEPDVSAFAASGAEVAVAAAAIDAGSDVAAPDEQDTPDVSASAGEDVKSLEDSVKEMLRPLLREWLDDNMDRIVQDAVKDEMASGHLRADKN